MSINNFLLNLYFKNFTVRLYFLYVETCILYVTPLLFIIRFINSYFIHYFKLKKLEFK